MSSSKKAVDVVDSAKPKDVVKTADPKVDRASPQSFFLSPTVTIKIGDGLPVRFAPKALLEAYSPFFATCLKPGFREGDSLVVEFDDVPGRSIDTFLTWLFTGSLNSVDASCYDDSPFIPKLYEFANRLMSPDFKDTVVTKYKLALRQKNVVPNIKGLVELDAVGLLDSKLGKFILHSIVWAVIHGTYTTASVQGVTSETYLKTLVDLPDEHKKVKKELLECLIQHRHIVPQNWKSLSNDGRYLEKKP